MKKLLAALVIITATTVSAEAVTISGGAGGWKEKPTGWIEYTKGNIAGTGISSKTEVDVKDDLHIGDETKASGWFKISDIPYLPDTKVKYTPMKFTGSGYASTTFTFGSITVPAGSKVESKLEANQIDVTLTYGLPFTEKASNGRFNFQWGLNVKVIDGYAKVKYFNPVSGWKEETKSATIPVPMAHLEGEIKPLNPVEIALNGNWIGYSGSQFYEIESELKVYPVKNLFVGIGYKYQRLKIDDISDVSADLKVKGAFFEAGLLF